MNFKRVYSGKVTLSVVEREDGLTIEISKKPVIVAVRKKRAWTWDRGTQIRMIRELMSTGPVKLQELYHYMSAGDESKRASIRGSIYHNDDQFVKVERGCWALK